jgi:hypothetical protein
MWESSPLNLWLAACKSLEVTCLCLMSWRFLHRCLEASVSFETWNFHKWQLNAATICF